MSLIAALSFCSFNASAATNVNVNNVTETSVNAIQQEVVVVVVIIILDDGTVIIDVLILLPV